MGIQGYFDEPSVMPGDTVTIRVATDSARFRVDFYRQGVALELGLSTDWFDGSGFAGADHLPWDDWGKEGTLADGSGPTGGWNGLPFAVPEEWGTGVYIAVFIEWDGNGSPPGPASSTTTADARTGKAMLVVLDPAPGWDSQVLYKIPLFTYQSYNNVGGNSIYQGVDVSLHRPGGGTGGTPWDAWNYDPKDPDTPRQVFAHWDAKLIAWLENKGYRLDYCTDLDVHRGGLDFLRPYSLVLSTGHDEYYSTSMRTAIQSYVAEGGNFALFSGNTCWWRTEFDDSDPWRMHGQQTIHHWSDAEVGDPEDSLTGVSYRNAGEGNQDRAAIGYTVQHTEQWPFENTGLSDGDVIGQEDELVGYECDGAPYDKGTALPISPRFDAGVGTPAGLMLLGTADVSAIQPPSGGGNGNAGATMAMYTANGTVFTGGTTDWPRVAALGDARVGTITTNVIDRLGGNPKGLATLANLGGIVGCDGFFTPDDGFRHAIVGTNDGNVTEIFFHPTKGQGQSVIATFGGLVDVAGFWTDDDSNRHAIAATDSGDIWEVFFNPETGIGQARLGNIPGAIRVAGFYSADDRYRHAIVATASGDVFEIYFSPSFGSATANLGNFPGLVDIGGFYSPDDNYRHVIVGQADGTVTEIYFNPGAGIFQGPIGSVPGLARVSAYYATDDRFFNRRATIAADDGRVHEIRFHPDFGIMRVLLWNEEVSDVGAFFSSDDGFRHALFATSDGDVEELFFRP